MKKRIFDESFFLTAPAREGSTLIITGQEAKHIVTVLRRRPGESITVVDGRGGRYRVEIQRCSSAEVVGEILDEERTCRPEREVWLAAGIIRAPRMDTLVEKCTELGVGALIPLCARRSVSGKSPSDARLGRWKRIAAAAMAQSARLFVPEVYGPIPVAELPGIVGPDAAILLADPSGKSMRFLDPDSLLGRRLVGCVGPEGGFTVEELEVLLKAGAVAVSLGQARLRTETAAVSLIDRLMFLLES